MGCARGDRTAAGGGLIELLETPRLRGEPLRAEHAPELAELLLDPQVYPWLWEQPEPPTLEDVAGAAAANESHLERYGFGLWLLRDRETAEVVGRGGLKWASPPQLQDVEAAWAIVSRRWGQGLATEVAHAAVGFGFEQLGLDQVIAFTLTNNHASRRVMEKTGFAFERNIVLDQLPHVLYRRHR